METRHIGRAVPRTEDGRLLTGRALFVDDVVRPGMLHAAFLRSPHARARIAAIDAAAAQAAGRLRAAHHLLQTHALAARTAQALRGHRGGVHSEGSPAVFRINRRLQDNRKSRPAVSAAYRLCLSPRGS